ncbi:MAG: ATP-binding cassette domain-containing protein [Candidatus Micrarchaeota archaeon]|nr:ATP-binding cassette domain-containing protein [Candidatus Micrarchaeota archaeon]
MSYVIEIDGLHKHFGDVKAVNGISLKVKQGEIFGLLGPNGSGKTTTLSMLATLIKPTKGTAYVDGHDILKEPSRVRAAIGFVFQEPSSDDLLTGKENLYIHSLLYGVKVADLEKRIQEAFKLVDLTDRQNSIVRTYSGGMRRRLEIARGLMHQPKILFLDEPTLGLDPQTRDHLWKYIKKLSTERGVSVIITTHYMDEADVLCDRVGIISAGRIIATDTPANLKKSLGGDIITMKIKSPNTAAIRRLKYVKKVERSGDILRLTVKDSDLHLQELLKKIGKVESVEARSPSLNDVFIKYTGRNIEDNSAEGGWSQRMIQARSRNE